MRDIQHHLASTLSAGAQRGDHFEDHRRGSRCCPACGSTRPLEESSSRWSTTGAIRVKVRVDHRVASRSAHIAVGVDMDGIKHVLGIWVQAEEGASFWAHVCAELANRGVKDVLIVCCDGLTGLPEAIEATWPQATVQTCVVHLIRASMRFVSYGDRQKVAAALKAVYTAPSQEAAWQALTDFSESDMGVKYPQTVATWERAWERFIPFLDFPPMLRRVISPPLRGRYPLHQQYRDCELPAAQGSPMNRGHFPFR